MRNTFDPWAGWANAVQLGYMITEAQMVIAMRLMGMAGLWSITPREKQTMVTEKAAALTRSWMNMQSAALSGKSPAAVAASGIRPIRNRTRSNVRRLSKRGPA